VLLAQNFTLWDKRNHPPQAHRIKDLKGLCSVPLWDKFPGGVRRATNWYTASCKSAVS